MSVLHAETDALPRSATTVSIRSWWSDSNPPGPTLSLHALTKPLLRLLHHRQARDFIKEQREAPLTTGTLRIFLSYVRYKYTSLNTKELVLVELCDRAMDESDAQLVVEELEIEDGLLEGLLDWPTESRMRRRACQILGRLAQHESVAKTLLALNPCALLLPLLGDSDMIVRRLAVFALEKVSSHPRGALAIVDALVLKDVMPLLSSADAETVSLTCHLLGNVASQKSGVNKIIAFPAALGLVGLLENDSASVRRGAIFALAKICRLSEGASFVLDAGVRHHLRNLLQSSVDSLRAMTCEMVETLARHAYSAESPFKPVTKLCTCVIELGMDQEGEVFRAAVFGLTEICFSLPNRLSRATLLNLAADVLDHVQDPRALLEAASDHGEVPVEDNDLWQFLDVVLPVFTPASDHRRHTAHLVSCLGSSDSKVCLPALTELTDLSRDVEGARTVVAANALDSAMYLFHSSDERIRGWTCSLLGNLAVHRATMPVVLSKSPSFWLVLSLSDEHVGVRATAMFALSSLSYWVEGARSVVDADAMQHVVELLQSPIPAARVWTCDMLGNLAAHEITRGDVLALKPWTMLVNCLRDENMHVSKAAASVLRTHLPQCLDDWLPVQQVASHVLRSSNVLAREWLSRTLGGLTIDATTSALAEQLRPCSLLVTLSADRVPRVRRSAMTALARLSRVVAGAQAVVAANALARAQHFLCQLEDVHCRARACLLLGNLATHKQTISAILELGLGTQVVSLLGDLDFTVRECAIFALSRITCWDEGVRAVGALGGLKQAAEFLHSPRASTQIRTCRILGRIASHASTLTAALSSGNCANLVFLLSERNSETCISAVYALAKISYFKPGAEVAVRAQVLQKVPHLLASNVPQIRQWTCEMLQNLASHESIRKTMFDHAFAPQIEFIVRDSLATVSAISTATD